MCTSPRTASFNLDGSINFSKKLHDRQMVPFQLPCGKCVECYLERARDWSIRCVHESKIHEQNAFVTLTYDPDHMPADGKVNHFDFQLFMKRLRKKYGEGIGYYMCGEYGEKTRRPHYHACIFGLDLPDKKVLRENHHGDTIWYSQELTDLWQLGLTEVGSVTQKSAGYVARYIMKKHDPDFPQGYQKMSTRPAIGKRWIEKHWEDVFLHARGAIVLSDGTKTKVPRYYEKWFRDNHPERWMHYVSVKAENTKRLEQKALKQQAVYHADVEKRGLRGWSYLTPQDRRAEVLKYKIQKLKKEHL